MLILLSALKQQGAEAGGTSTTSARRSNLTKKRRGENWALLTDIYLIIEKATMAQQGKEFIKA